jgi:ketosteroid isomerase-like protein
MPDDVLSRAAAALQALDAAALTALYADDFTFEDVPGGQVITNRLALRAYFDRLFSLPGVRFPDAHFYSMGERGTGNWTWSGLSRSGKPYAIRGASLFELAGDRIKRETLFYDPRPAYE